jgi:hypothetical protein
MRKTADAPRRLYISSDETVFVRFNARLYAAPTTSDIDPSEMVTCKALPSNGGRARIEVRTEDGVVEVWRSITAA